MIGPAVYTVMFYVLAVLAVLFALLVVNTRRLLRAAIWLMAVLVSSAGLYAMLGYEFLGGVQILVYVGGIVVLIVFAIMLTSSADLLEDNPAPRRKITGAIASIGFLAVTLAALMSSSFPLLRGGIQPGNDAAALGQKLLDYGARGYVLPFEIISLLLLAAVIGGIVIARKVPPADQPFTTGGDLPGEADATRPNEQLRDEQLHNHTGGGQ